MGNDVTFTLPRQWRSLVWRHQRVAYDLLLSLGWQTLLSFGLNDTKLKGTMGAHAVLHTHSRRIDFHPHVHFIVPAGALDPKHRSWRKKAGKYLFHQGNLTKVFRAKWFDAMQREGLKVSATVPKDWVVDMQACRSWRQGAHLLGEIPVPWGIAGKGHTELQKRSSNVSVYRKHRNRQNTHPAGC